MTQLGLCLGTFDGTCDQLIILHNCSLITDSLAIEMSVPGSRQVGAMSTATMHPLVTEKQIQAHKSVLQLRC